MKKLLLFTLLIISINLNAQTEKGKYFLSGATNASLLLSDMANTNDNTYTNINIAPSLGYFVIKDVVLGISFLYNYSERSNSNYRIETSTYQFTPFARCYLLNLNSITCFYAQAEGGYIETDSQNGVVYSGELGMAIFSNQHVSFDIGALFSYSEINKNQLNTFGLNFGVSVYLGK